MVFRLGPDGQGGWEAALCQGAAAFGRHAFPDRAAAEDWAARAALATRQCTIRIGSKRFLGTAAEAAQRWAIDQGTLPRAEGGTHLAPIRRLDALMRDAACAWPLTLLNAPELVALRRRRLLQLGSAELALAEQAALAVAIEQFREMHLPALDDAFDEPAPDGIWLLDSTACGLLRQQAEAMGGAWPRLVGLLLTSGGSASDLLQACCGQADRGTGRLYLAGGRQLSAPPEHLPVADNSPEAPLLPGLALGAELETGFATLARCLGQATLLPEALQMTALAALLAQGWHLDEMMRACAAVPSPPG
ncbi:hypothetical protein ACFOD4_13810 [Pseudoroseomonas globiformis]|uniref:Uncharacterized protein n=1 Tax=Teichococcus globiformis TaxID=2307229 RepID=A0ABV7G0C4_9PROT